MITNILKRTTCAQCLICCQYTDEDVWDAPGFTQKEFETHILGHNINYYCYNNLYYVRMEKNKKNEYVCPFLSDNGCILGSKKPFKCAIWPLYIVNINNRIAIAVSDVCSNVYSMNDNDILQNIKYILPEIKATILNYPELVEQYRDNFRLLAYLEI